MDEWCCLTAVCVCVVKLIKSVLSNNYLDPLSINVMFFNHAIPKHNPWTKMNLMLLDTEESVR